MKLSGLPAMLGVHVLELESSSVEPVLISWWQELPFDL